MYDDRVVRALAAVGLISVALVCAIETAASARHTRSAYTVPSPGAVAARRP